jgi:ABC-type Zn2+ transport system substrate-binding protein/surface adhesin
MVKVEVNEEDEDEDDEDEDEEDEEDEDDANEDEDEANDEVVDVSDVAMLEKAAKLIQVSGGLGGTRSISEYFAPVSSFTTSA